MKLPIPKYTSPSIAHSVLHRLQASPIHRDYSANGNDGTRMICAGKLYRTPKSVKSDLKPTISLLRDISHHAHQMISWYEFPEKISLLKLLHDLGQAVLTVDRQGLDDAKNEAYSLLFHEIERGRSTVNGFFQQKSRHVPLLASSCKGESRAVVVDNILTGGNRLKPEGRIGGRSLRPKGRTTAHD